MSDVDLKPGKRRRWLAVVFAALGVVNALLLRTLSSKLNMCAGLLMAWDMAFMPSPSPRTPLREIYERARRGWRNPWQSKLILFASTALLVAAQYYSFHGG